MRQGYQVNFIPGWDCHGLPIELKVFKDSDKLTGQLEPLEIRSKGISSISAEFSCYLST